VSNPGGTYWVRFANRQGDGFFGSLDEARHVIDRRAEHVPNPRGIFPAEIWVIPAGGHGDDANFVERRPGPAT
jgi:hypothetical protein